MAFDPEKLSQSIIRHEIAARDLDAGEADKIVRLLNGTIADLNEKLLGRYALAQAKGVDRGPATTRRLEEMLEGFEALNSTVYKKIGERVEGQLIDRARHEMTFARDAAKSAGAKVEMGTRLPDTNYLRQLVRNTPIPVDENTATLLQPWLKDMEANNLKRLGETLRSGFAQGATPAELAKTLQDRAFAKSRNSAQALALTANSAVANQARLETFRKMPGITHVEWSSVLDKSTTPGCQNLSGKIFPIDAPHPTPPRHIRCRSLLLPRKNDTDPPLHKPYSEWLKGQSSDVQDEALQSKKRGDLFRAGDLKGDELYAPTGRFRTLEELKKGDAKITAPAAAPAAPVRPVIDTAKIDANAKSYCLDKGRKTGNEHLVCYDSETGETVETKEGDRSSVAFTPKLVKLLDNPASKIVLHHNHPRSSSLSLPDMLVVTKKPGAKAIWAHGHNGSSFYAEPGAIAFSERTAKAIANAIHAQLQKLVSAAIVTVADAMLLDNHLTWIALQRLGQISYRAELAGDSLKAFERNKVIYERILEGLK